MQRFSSYKRSLKEEFNIHDAVKDALIWLENKYGKDLYTFKHIEKMNMDGDTTKVYDIHVKDNAYVLNLKKFNSVGDDLDILGFDVYPANDSSEEGSDGEEEEL